MSTLAISRPRSVTPVLELTPIDPDAPGEADLRAVVRATSRLPLAEWRRARPVENEWDDLINEVCGFGPPPVGSSLEAALLALARSSDECVVWYPGKRENIASVFDEAEFARIITAKVASGDIEPTLRFMRLPEV